MERKPATSNLSYYHARIATYVLLNPNVTIPEIVKGTGMRSPSTVGLALRELGDLIDREPVIIDGKRRIAHRISPEVHTELLLSYL
jgi:hypothetical protein